MMELEGRALLSTFTGNNAVHHVDLDTLRPAGDTPALNDVVIRGDSARVDGGLPHDGSATRRDVAIGNNTVHQGSGLSGARDVIHARRVHSRRAATGTIISQTFNDTKSPPEGWAQFTQYGTVVQSPKTYLTITDTSGSSAGIASTASTVPFSLKGVTTTITAQISSVSVSPKVGNAIVGVIGPNGTQQPGILAAGIDSQSNVFYVEYDPTQKITTPNVVVIGQDTGYKGGPVTLTLTINSTGIQINAGSFKSRVYTFSKDLNNFSVNKAFPNNAVPALVAASQQNQARGAASFQSIIVSTSSGGQSFTGGRAARGGRRAPG
jgi:hypothetical protein